MKQPQNYQEQQAKAKQEIRLKIIELEERIEALQRLHDRFETVNWADPGGLLADVEMHGDADDLGCINEIVTFWPDVATAPGEGYW